jgi:hypothetical protein
MRVQVVLTALALVCSQLAHAQSRFIVVNGQRMTDAQAAALDRMQCTRIPNGAYWLNTNTGVWGYAGNPRPQGRLGDLCRAGGGHSGGGGWNRNTPGGNWGGDGRCSYYSHPDGPSVMMGDC